MVLDSSQDRDQGPGRAAREILHPGRGKPGEGEAGGERKCEMIFRDANNNTCSTEYFGSAEEAQKAIDSLQGCSDCSDCSDCSGCSRCSGNTGIAKPTALTIPKLDNIHTSIFAAASKPNALEMNSFHKCEKTHCRAGWTVVLAGDAGLALERFYNTELAAMLIYRESGYKINPARFYDDNK